jgi:DNA-binding transcriptional MerR regulator
VRIGELAARAGTTTRALRYYESRGLLAARRDGNGYRTYCEEDLHLLQQLRTLQDFGFELEEARPFVDCLRAGHQAGDDCPASLEVYRRKLAEIDACIAQLQAVRDEVGQRLARAEAEQRRGAHAGTGAQSVMAAAAQPRCEFATPHDPVKFEEPHNASSNSKSPHNTAI